MSEQTAAVSGRVGLAHPQPRERREPLPWRGAISQTRVAWTALTGLSLTIVAVVISSGSTPLLSPDSTRLGLPPYLAGVLSGLGPHIPLAGLIAMFTFMGVCYCALAVVGHRLSGRVIVGTIIGLHVLIALAPPLLSTDVFSYGAYGRMDAIYKLNPYLHGPNAIQGPNSPYSDPWVPLIGSQWTSTPTAYGPLFTALSYVMAHLTIGTAALVYKCIAVGASLLAIAGTGRAAGRLGVDRMRAVTLIGLNPVLLVYAVGGSHNDLIMIAALVWSLVALVGRRAWAGGGLIIVAIAVKLTAGIVLPFALVKPREPGEEGRSSTLLIGAGVALVLVLAFTAALFGASPLQLLNTLAVIQGHGGKQSIPGIIAYGFGLGTLSRVVTGALAACLVVCVLALLHAVRSGRIDWITATGWAIVGLLLTTTFLLPWYVIWLLPFAALSRSRGLTCAVLALTAIGLTSL